MTERVAVELGNVQRTLLLPLWGRAVETVKPHPLLVDRTAVEILQRVDYDFSAIAAGISPMSQAAWIMRANVTDEVIRGFLAAHPRGSVVNIGCGMDTTFERVDNGSLLWYDLDLSDVIALRRRFLPESPRRVFLETSFLDPAWLDSVRSAEGVLFVAAGVFYYFKAEEIRSFLISLADRFPGAEALFDVCSPYGLKVANRLVIRSAGLDERSFLTWSLGDARELLAWDPRFQIRRTHLYYRRAGLPIRIRLIGLIADWMKFQYMIHLQMAG